MISYATTEETLPAKTAEWLERIKSSNTHRMSLNVGKSALLVIDSQKYFFDSDSSSFTSGDAAVLRNIRNIIDGFHKAGMPVIYTCHVHRADRSDAGIMEWWWDDMCIEGSEDAKINEKIAPLATEKIIFKHRYSAFYNTDLETVLRVLKIEDLVITGIMTNLCCESTARDVGIIVFTFSPMPQALFAKRCTLQVCSISLLALLTSRPQNKSWNVSRMALLLAAVRLLFLNEVKVEFVAEDHKKLWKWAIPAGGCLGLLSGMTGIGGCVFLSPILLLSGRADAKRTAAVSSLFIVLNSLSGLGGHLTRSTVDWSIAFPLAFVVLTGGFVGSRVGAEQFQPKTLQGVLALVLIVAGMKMLSKNFL